MQVTYLQREAVRNNVARRVAALAARRREIERVILFGSLATGQAVPGSDADLLVILARSDLPFLDRIPLYMPEGCGIAVDVFPYTQAEVREMRASGHSLVRRALSEGYRLFDRDWDLVACWNAGDQAAFDELYRRYWQRIFLFLMKRLLPFFRARVGAKKAWFLAEEEAADLAQDVFVKLVMGRIAYRRDRGASLPTLLFRIAKNAFLDFKEKAERELPAVEERWNRLLAGVPDDPDPDEDPEMRVHLLALRECYLALPGRQRAVVDLKGAGKTAIGIADELGIAENPHVAVSRLWKRALENLRRCLAKKGIRSALPRVGEDRSDSGDNP